MMALNLFEDSLAPPTRFDLSFRIGDIPVRASLLLGEHDLSGLGHAPRRSRRLALPVRLGGLLFISILVHELGHILMGRYFGNRGHIILTGFCGLAVGSSDLPRRWQRVAVHLAGPAAGFVLAAVVTVLFWLINPPIALFLLGSLFGVHVRVAPDVDVPSELVWYIVHNLMWINIFWGLVNLLPIWPLDGGQVSREICQAYRAREGMRLSLQISLLTAVGFAVLALVELATKKPLVPFLSLGGSLFPVLFFGILALNSWQLLKFVRHAGPDWEEQEQDNLDPWQQDADWWKRGDNPWRE